MKTYCVKCRKDTNNINPKIFRTKNNRLLMQSTCSDCKNKKSRFVKNKMQKAIEKNLTVNLLELILVKKIMMQTMKLVEYKRLLVILIKTK